MAAEQITYGQLDKLLKELGFVAQQAEPNSKWYEHKTTDTVIVLTDKNSTETARPTEIVSTRFVLDHKGLLSEEAFDNFFENGFVRK